MARRLLRRRQLFVAAVRRPGRARRQDRPRVEPAPPRRRPHLALNRGHNTIFRFLSALLLGRQNATGQSLEPLDEILAAKGPTRMLMLDEPLYVLWIVALPQIGSPVRDRLLQRERRKQRMSDLPDVGVGARPIIILCGADNPGSDRIPLDIADGRVEMALIKRIGDEPPLPQIALPILSGVDDVRVFSVGLADPRAKLSRSRGRDEEALADISMMTLNRVIGIASPICNSENGIVSPI